MNKSKKTKKSWRINRQLSQLNLVAIASLLLIGAAVSWAQEVPATTSTPPSVNIQFQPPSSEVPRRVLGGGSRGSIGFTPTDDKPPSTVRGGGSRGELGFTPGDDRVPSTVRGGGSRDGVDFTPADDRVPSSTKGGGSRSDPRLLNPAPLLPSTNLGWTISERPTVFLYIPPTSAKQVFFSLHSEDRQYHYQTTFELNKTGGIVAIQVPREAPPLEMGKPYQWSVILLEPGEIMRPDARSITGWVKRVPVPQSAGSLNAIELAALYGKSGIWYDTLNILSSARSAQPENATLAKEWGDLLQQVGLEHLAQTPLTEQL